MHQRGIARTQHNQVEEGVGYQLALENNFCPQAYWLREQSDNIYAQIDLIVAERYGTIKLLAQLIVQVEYLDAVALDGIVVAVVIANVTELVARLNVENIWQALLARNL